MTYKTFSSFSHHNTTITNSFPPLYKLESELSGLFSSSSGPGFFRSSLRSSAVDTPDMFICETTESSGVDITIDWSADCAAATAAEGRLSSSSSSLLRGEESLPPPPELTHPAPPLPPRSCAHCLRSISAETAAAPPPLPHRHVLSRPLADRPNRGRSGSGKGASASKNMFNLRSWARRRASLACV